jgi:hypothetical protein
MRRFIVLVVVSLIATTRRTVLGRAVDYLLR